ncbi:uncharacterized protein LOC134286650 [Aedes albopictus]|uniref:Retrotransposon gag domain-containing protein n=1 Tax=Aedes albopictus TaxID=7160 RepID=A0ABM1Z5S5_AEDAL
MSTTAKDLSCNIPLQEVEQTSRIGVTAYACSSKGVVDVLTKKVPAAGAEKIKFEEMDWISKALLVSCQSDEYLEIVREKATTKEMWTSLKTTYAKKSVASQTIIRKQLARLRMNEGEDVQTHLLEFEGLVRKLKTAGATLAESDLVS